MTVRDLAVFSVTVCLMATLYVVFSSNALFSSTESETILILGFLAVLSVVLAVVYSRETIDGETACGLVIDALYIVVRPENHPHIAFREKVDLRLRATTFKYE
ncbi:hypothetical protein E8E13_006808 [Curvularia kusanoi]|uniref:Uncharacterized protein n=1 Tax=Curvularia kusanoi TaxID=90978 RepID=A0A9P4TBD4_CURKU|nr:hypothetical protein E8E13_006808 [Curvularia kusanoi]